MYAKRLLLKKCRFLIASVGADGLGKSNSELALKRDVMSIVGRSSGFGVNRRVCLPTSIGRACSGVGGTRCRPLRRRNRVGIEERGSSHLASLLSFLRYSKGIYYIRCKNAPYNVQKNRLLTYNQFSNSAHFFLSTLAIDKENRGILRGVADSR